MTREDAVREIVGSFDAVAQQFSDTAEEFEGVKRRCRDALAALGVTDDEVEDATASDGFDLHDAGGDVRGVRREQSRLRVYVPSGPC